MGQIYRLKFKPPPALQQDVKSFWFLDEAQEVYNLNEIIPDSYRELIISLGAPIMVETESGALFELPRVYLSPLHKRPQKFRTTGFSQIVAVSLYPWATLALLDQGATTVENDYIVLESSWQNFAASLGRTVARSGYQEAIAQLQQFVCDQWHEAPRDLPSMRTIGQLIYTRRGQLTMTELAAQCTLSSSQFERRFKHFTSLTPKAYARLVRFESIRNALLLNPSSNLAGLAQEYGYTDQAHFNHDFKAFAAQTPGSFAASAKLFSAEQRLADFLQYA
ncbi:MAG: helix-turn-helix transcriptional regulator [Chloroflexota bacterium]